MIVVIFLSACAHMQYLRCSLVIYAPCGQFRNVMASAVCAPLKTTFYRYLSLQPPMPERMHVTCCVLTQGKALYVCV